MSQHTEPKWVALLMSHKDSWISLWVFGIEYTRFFSKYQDQIHEQNMIVCFTVSCYFSSFPFISSHNILFMGFIMLYITGQWKETGNINFFFFFCHNNGYNIYQQGLISEANYPDLSWKWWHLQHFIIRLNLLNLLMH